MKTKFNLVGDTFTHLTGGNKGYSVHGKESRYIEWVQDGSGEATFFIDDKIFGVMTVSKGQRLLASFRPIYGWLLESKNISGAIDRMKETEPEIYDHFTAIFTHDKELIEMNPEKFKFVPAQGSWINNKNFYNRKTRLASMIASNKDWTEGHRKRLSYAEKLKDQLDLFGRGFKEIETKELGLDPYMFSVAIENGCYETYFTEKILDCFMTFTVPVYLGAPDIGDHFNMDGIILLNENFDMSQLSPERYESMRLAIQDNWHRALKMEILEDYIWENYLNG